MRTSYTKILVTTFVIVIWQLYHCLYAMGNTPPNSPCSPKNRITLKDLIAPKEHPLKKALREGDEDQLKLLLEDGADACSLIEGRCLLAWVETYKKYTLVELILNHYIQTYNDIDAKNNNGNTLLHEVVRVLTHDMSRLIALLAARGASLSSLNSNKQTVLQQAVKQYTGYMLHDKLATIRCLILCGAQLNTSLGATKAIQDLKKQCGEDIRLAAALGTIKDLERARLKQLVDYSGDTGFTPLYLATLRNQREIVKKLLEHGAQLNQPGASGLTPLHVAALTDNYGLAELFLEKEALIAAATGIYQGLTPLALATNNNSKQVVGLLLDKLSSACILRFKLLEYIAQHGSLELIHSVLTYGFNPQPALRLLRKRFIAKKDLTPPKKIAYYETLLKSLESEAFFLNWFKTLIREKETTPIEEKILLWEQLPEEIWLLIGSYVIGKNFSSKTIT